MKIADLDEAKAHRARASMERYLRYAEAKRAAKRSSKPPINPQLVSSNHLAPEPLHPASKPAKPKLERIDWVGMIVEFLKTTNGRPVLTEDIVAGIGALPSQTQRISNALQWLRNDGKVVEAGRVPKRRSRPVVLWALKQEIKEPLT